jgi:hypothetical protein
MNNEDLEELRRANPFADIVQEGNRYTVVGKGLGVCDFCTAPLLRKSKRFHARTISVMVSSQLPYHSLEDWGACDDCAPLVEKGLKDDLVDRALEVFAILRPENTAYPSVREELRESVIWAHSMFWSAKI